MAINLARPWHIFWITLYILIDSADSSNYAISLFYNDCEICAGISSFLVKYQEDQLLLGDRATRKHAKDC